MEITSSQSFVNYLDKVKDRTKRLFDFIPEDKLEWTYMLGKFTVGDQIRHMATIERFMFAENVQMKPSKYRGCGEELASGKENVIQFYQDMQAESRRIFLSLSDQDFLKKCKTPAGIEITIWKWLRAMIEHEIHHRGQLYVYLGMLNIQLPPIYGLTSEEVMERSVWSL